MKGDSLAFRGENHPSRGKKSLMEDSKDDTWGRRDERHPKIMKEIFLPSGSFSQEEVLRFIEEDARKNGYNDFDVVYTRSAAPARNGPQKSFESRTTPPRESRPALREIRSSTLATLEKDRRAMQATTVKRPDNDPIHRPVVTSFVQPYSLPLPIKEQGTPELPRTVIEREGTKTAERRKVTPQREEIPRQNHFMKEERELGGLSRSSNAVPRLPPRGTRLGENSIGDRSHLETSVSRDNSMTRPRRKIFEYDFLSRKNISVSPRHVPPPATKERPAPVKEQDCLLF
eukprot:TRINITY_DN2866_c0_g1_i2.p1 TRINITY_DN2866_c0_g1~~TRINITY_DN2866_c0_g1_i2.p1  ORF type:complete len:287 (-),score=64.82 TRINITY_DN2866_c0_g1_i2:134-994(-)